MKRREFAGTMGAIGISVAVAGCSGSANVDGNIVVDESISGDNVTFRFDVEDGQTINLYLSNEQGQIATTVLADPEDENILTHRVETEGTTSHQAEQTGAYSVYVSASDAVIQVGISE